MLNEVSVHWIKWQLHHEVEQCSCRLRRLSSCRRGKRVSVPRFRRILQKTEALASATARAPGSCRGFSAPIIRLQIRPHRTQCAFFCTFSVLFDAFGSFFMCNFYVRCAMSLPSRFLFTRRKYPTLLHVSGISVFFGRTICDDFVYICACD